MHLAERDAHLLEHVLFLDAGTDQVGLQDVGEVLHLELGGIVVDDGRVRHLGGGAVVVVGVGELVAGTDAGHPQVLIGVDGVAGAQAAHVEHHGLAVQARLVLVDHRLHLGIVLGDHRLDLLLDGVVEQLGQLPQALPDLGGTEEVELDPGDAVLLFHHLAHVVHGAVAVDHVQLDLVGRRDLLHLAVAGPDRLDVEAALLKQRLGGPGVAADVVLADQRDVVGADRLREFAGLDDVVADGVVGDVVPQGLGNAAETLAVTGDDRDVQLLGGDLGDRVDVVADQADRALGEDRHPLGQREQFLGFAQQHGELLVAAVDHVLLLEVGGELHREAGDAGYAAHQVAPGTPGVPAAADRAVRDVDHVADRAPDHPFGPCIGATAGAHHAGDGLLVGLYAGRAGGLVVGGEVRGAFFPPLLRVELQDLVDHGLGRLLGDAFNRLDFNL